MVKVYPSSSCEGGPAVQETEMEGIIGGMPGPDVEAGMQHPHGELNGVEGGHNEVELYLTS